MSSSLPRQKLHGWLFTPIPKPRLDGKKNARWLSLEVTLDTTGLIYHLGSRELNHPQKEGHLYAELPGTLVGFISDFSLGTFSCRFAFCTFQGELPVTSLLARGLCVFTRRWQETALSKGVGYSTVACTLLTLTANLREFCSSGRNSW